MEHTTFSPATRSWFDASFDAPTEVQRRGWEAIGRGAHALLVAPTGSGKTLAAFLATIDRLATGPEPQTPGVRVVYVSPLKALVYDIERNLRAPLRGVELAAARLGTSARPLTVSVRTGDTPPRERQRQLRAPGEILVTTPESLYLILGSRARATLGTVETLIVDEIHALAATKRGVHLALSLERVAEIAAGDPQRIGLSATVRPHDEVARFLGGDRPVEVIDAARPPCLDLAVCVPVPDMTEVAAAGLAQPSSGARAPAPASAAAPTGARGTSPAGLPDGSSGTTPAALTGDRPGGSILRDLYDREIGTPPPERGLWAAIYPRLLEEILAHHATIVFVNSRGLCERLARRLNELAGQELVRAHHGSVSHEQRRAIEEGLKRGQIRGIVATSSLELGIDMGAVDQVLLVESPGSVARGLQRVGRAGHRVGETSVGRIYPKFRGDLLESAVVARRMREGEIERLTVPQNALDVLAQQLVALCADGEREVEALARLVRRAYPYHQLGREALTATLDMLSGRYPSTELADLRPLLAWDRTADRVRGRRGATLVARLNGGTIPDRGTFSVHLGEDGPRVGELDEEMVYETRRGDHILLGASTWRVEAISRDRVVVVPAPGEPGRLPFWKGEGPGRPIELGRALGAFLRAAAAVAPERLAEWIATESPLDPLAAQNLAAYLEEQRTATGVLPSDRLIVVERFRDELGDWRVCILTPFGARIHAPWAMAVQRMLAVRSGCESQIMYADDGIVVRLADTEELPDLELLLPDPDGVRDLVTEQLADTALFAGLFRENAARALLLKRWRGGGRRPLWAQRLKAQQLLGAVRRYPGFPVVLETYRQALGDVFDLPGLEGLLRDVRA
ncbi:MAG: DEAD/DEAH box helicase, partial [Candidatus Eiseniibacteriota bacterium]